MILVSMKEDAMKRGITRRNLLKLPVFGLGALGLGGLMSRNSAASESASAGAVGKGTPLLKPLQMDEMRITFFGTSCIARTAQECNSIYVEVGSGDQFIFDCGTGVAAKYNAMGIPFSKMDKIFLTHLHGDHTSDLTHIYCFGPSGDRKTPLQVWGPSRSNMVNPTTGENPDDGTTAFFNAFRTMMSWHVQAFSFLNTGLDARGSGNNGYDLAVNELDWGVDDPTRRIYNKNGVTITYFPAAHDRNGSISYKLVYNGLSMIFTGDTKPNDYVINRGQGVDVLIHEMVVPPETWASKNSGLQPGDPGWEAALQTAQNIQDSSHTPQKAFGYIMSQTNPRLAVATHFQVNPDTTGPALKDIRTWYKGPVVFATDLLVLTVSRKRITQRKASINNYAWLAPGTLQAGLFPAEYPTPTYQLDQTILLDHCIPPSVYDPAE
jgi:ribonuclease Z